MGKIYRNGKQFGADIPTNVVVSSDDDETVTDNDIPTVDADTLGGLYTADDITELKNQIEELKALINN